MTRQVGTQAFGPFRQDDAGCQGLVEAKLARLGRILDAIEIEVCDLEAAEVIALHQGEGGAWDFGRRPDPAHRGSRMQEGARERSLARA